MKNKNVTPANTSNRKITAIRVLDVSRELVYKVWTEPRHIAHWWGPKGFKNTIEKMDVRPGGNWQFIMHGPDGVDYPNNVTYVDVKKNERLVYNHGKEGQPDNFQATITFEEQGNKTKLSMQMLFQTEAQRNQVIEKYNADEGLKQNMERLENYLRKFTR